MGLAKIEVCGEFSFGHACFGQYFVESLVKFIEGLIESSRCVGLFWEENAKDFTFVFKGERFAIGEMGDRVLAEFVDGDLFHQEEWE